jgi:hypothetical protein
VKHLVLAVLISSYQSLAQARNFYDIDVDRFCAKVVGIPYASDNFTDQEWKEFQDCRNHFIEVQRDY